MAKKKEENTEVQKDGLNSVIDSITKKFGKTSIRRLGDNTVENIPAISTGALNLDMALGIGGLPKGRIEFTCYC
jgi:recombination protein RecA